MQFGVESSGVIGGPVLTLRALLWYAVLRRAVLHPGTHALEGGRAQREVPGVTHVNARRGQQHVLDASSSVSNSGKS
jgi:hypothetical protein